MFIGQLHKPEAAHRAQSTGWGLFLYPCDLAAQESGVRCRQCGGRRPRAAGCPSGRPCPYLGLPGGLAQGKRAAQLGSVEQGGLGGPLPPQESWRLPPRGARTPGRPRAGSHGPSVVAEGSARASGKKPSSPRAITSRRESAAQGRPVGFRRIPERQGAGKGAVHTHKHGGSKGTRGEAEPRGGGQAGP